MRDARTDGIRVDFTVAGGAPLWAQGASIPPQGLTDVNFAWKPNAGLYGQFVHAVGERYDGSYTPAGRVRALAGGALLGDVERAQLRPGPRPPGDRRLDGVGRPDDVPRAGRHRLALTAADRARLDTILIGGFAAEGRSGPVNAKHPQGLPGDYAQTKPLQYIPTLYCLSATDKPLRGSYAKARGCPTNAAGTRAFRAQHPGLFNAGGVSDHPYSGGRSPVDAKGLDKDFAIFSQLGSLERALDRAVAAYGSHKRYRIYSDEYGYITHPPQVAPYASPATASYYMNWAEYLSWRSPRIASYAQYLLRDPPSRLPDRLHQRAGDRPRHSQGDLLRLPDAALHAHDDAAHGTAGRDLGQRAARPLHGPGRQRIADGADPAPDGRPRRLRTVRTVAAGGYFDVRLPFTRCGNLRLAYTYPSADAFLPLGFAGSTAYSRIVKVKVSKRLGRAGVRPWRLMTSLRTAKSGERGARRWRGRRRPRGSSRARAAPA